MKKKTRLALILLILFAALLNIIQGASYIFFIGIPPYIVAPLIYEKGPRTVAFLKNRFDSFVVSFHLMLALTLFMLAGRAFVAQSAIVITICVLLSVIAAILMTLLRLLQIADNDHSGGL